MDGGVVFCTNLQNTANQSCLPDMGHSGGHRTFVQQYKKHLF